MIFLLFRYALRAGADLKALGDVSRRLYEVAARPEFGFRGGRNYRDDDGSFLAIYEFTDPAGMDRFRRDPEHVAAQRRATEFFEWLRTEICIVESRRDVIGTGAR